MITVAVAECWPCAVVRLGDGSELLTPARATTCHAPRCQVHESEEVPRDARAHVGERREVEAASEVGAHRPMHTCAQAVDCSAHMAWVGVERSKTRGRCYLRCSSSISQLTRDCDPSLPSHPCSSPAHTERDCTINMMVMMREYVASTSFTHVWYARSQEENFSTIWVLENGM